MSQQPTQNRTLSAYLERKEIERINFQGHLQCVNAIT